MGVCVCVSVQSIMDIANLYSSFRDVADNVMYKIQRAKKPKDIRSKVSPHLCSSACSYSNYG